MELAGLSFLGLGAKPPIPEWGSMMSDTRNLLPTQPWVTLAPGFAIFLSVMVFNLLGDTVRDYLDPENMRYECQKSFVMNMWILATMAF
jgi:peptide/nickel transport system permease protein